MPQAICEKRAGGGCVAFWVDCVEFWELNTIGDGGGIGMN